MIAFRLPGHLFLALGKKQMYFTHFQARANWGWWALFGMAEKRRLKFLETEIKGKMELEKGGKNLEKKSGKKGTALRDQRREGSK